MKKKRKYETYCRNQENIKNHKKKKHILKNANHVKSKTS